MIEETLKKLGMTENEARVYLALLSLGKATSGHIIKKTEFQSSVVYHLLNKLMEKGFASYVTENKKKMFSAADPIALEKLVDEKQNELNKLKGELNAEIKELELLKKSQKDEQKVTVFSGIKGLQTIQNDILNNAKEYLVYSTKDMFTKAMPKYRAYFREARIARKIKQKVIMVSDKKEPNSPYQEKKYMPKEYASPVGMMIYNKKVIIQVFDAEPPIAIVLEGEKISNAFKNIYETMWKSAKT